MVSLHFRALVNFGGGGDLLLAAADFFFNTKGGGRLFVQRTCVFRGGGRGGRTLGDFFLAALTPEGLSPSSGT